MPVLAASTPMSSNDITTQPPKNGVFMYRLVPTSRISNFISPSKETEPSPEAPIFIVM